MNRAKKESMSIQTAIAKLRRRNLNFATLKVALEHNGLPKSNGWGNLERKYADLKIPAADAVSHASKLERIYRNNIEWGNKAVQIAAFDISDASLFAAMVDHRFAPEFSPTNAFPDPVSDEDLALLTGHPVLVSRVVNQTATGATLYFYSRAYETDKEVFSVDEMKDDASRRRFAGFDQVVAYRRLIFQRIDSIHIDARNRRIEFRVDATGLPTIDRKLEALKELKEKFRKLMVTHIDRIWEKKAIQLSNFYPKIDRMYNGAIGTVVQLDHNTPAGAINHGKMRGKRGDLKNDPSHIASMDASDNEKFAIQKAYPYFNGLSMVHLSIPGKSADTGLANPETNTAIIENCIVGNQFEDMMQILR